MVLVRPHVLATLRPVSASSFKCVGTIEGIVVQHWSCVFIVLVNFMSFGCSEFVVIMTMTIVMDVDVFII